jgi:bifunctional DNA-binding transcriptional regulator/antitoxin component of YhaV-PrlF toxin-antitoxin module
MQCRLRPKGQVTIPQQNRRRLSLLPDTEVEFELAKDHVRIRKARSTVAVPDGAVRLKDSVAQPILA